jgi:hypothetical protein
MPLHAVARAATGSLEKMVRGLLTSGEEQAAYVSGIIWEITSDPDLARKVWMAAHKLWTPKPCQKGGKENGN